MSSSGVTGPVPCAATGGLLSRVEQKGPFWRAQMVTANLCRPLSGEALASMLRADSVAAC